ncbi:hypothetical protein ACJZ2D_016897 [Fusarium nematophilum]
MPQMKEIGSPLLELVEASIGLEYGHQVADIFIRPAKIVVDGVFAYKPVWVAPAEIVLDNGLADDHVA